MSCAGTGAGLGPLTTAFSAAALGDDDPIELIEGRLVVAEPRHSPHATGIELGSVRANVTDHPSTAALVVEVADSTLRLDRGPKPRVEARAAIPEYWIVNPLDRVVEVYRAPVSEGRRHARYTAPASVSPGDRISPIAAHVASIAVNDLLP